ncbi:MAG: RDD family protein [Acidobacteriota bacterium]
MARGKKTAEPSLPLFDLPLQADEDEGGQLQLGNPSSEPSLAPPSPAPLPPAPPQPSVPQQAARPAEAPGVDGVSTPLFSSEAGPGPAADLDGGPPPEPYEEFEETPRLQDRLLAGLADVGVVAVATGIMVLGSLGLGVELTLESWRPFVVFGLLFSFPYVVIPLAFWGRTPGMAWVGHSARTLDHEPLTFAQTARRWLGAVLTVALAGLPLALTFGGGRSLASRLSDSVTVLEP